MNSDKKWETANSRMQAFSQWLKTNPPDIKLPGDVIYRKFLEETGRLWE